MSIKVPGGSIELCRVQEEAMAECRGPCNKYAEAYEGCVARIGPNPPEGVNCQLQYFDFYRCLDKCVPNTLFSKLK